MGDSGLWLTIVWVLDGLGACFVTVSLILAITSRLKGRFPGLTRIVGALVVLGCFLPLCTGLAGWSVSNSAVDDMVLEAPVENREEVATLGREAASQPLKWGGGSTLCCLGPALLAILLAPGKADKWEQMATEEV